MNEDQQKFQSLMDAVGVQLHNKDIEIIIPVLTAQLANAGLMCGVSIEQLLRYVTMTLVFHYIENSSNNNPIH